MNLTPVGQETLTESSFGMQCAVEKIYPMIEVKTKSLVQSFKAKI